MSSADRARELLRQALGCDANFHADQLEAILALVDERARVLLVQRTGWGKSVVYFIATALLREQGQGPSILISPLLSLMRDQIRMAARLGVRAATINSQNAADRKRVEADLGNDAVDVLLVSPERLADERFRTTTLEQIEWAIGLLVVDEAHCISDWGHDFRPDYRRIGTLVANLPTGVPLLSTTATANNRVIGDITEQLGDGLLVLRGPLGRDSLHLQIVELPGQAERLAWLADYLPRASGSGIIYVLTTADAERVSKWLAQEGIDAPAYSGKLDAQSRETLEKRLLANDVKALVATVALGMGFDKPDLGFVVHYQRPYSPIAYYQQIGRAGRAAARAEVVLLAGEEDDAIADYFIGSAFPPECELRDVLAALEATEDLSVPGLQSRLNLSKSAIERALKILEIDGAVFKDGGRYARTPNRWSLDSQRVEQVTAQRLHERDRISLFVSTDECLMAFLRAELDDPTAERCGRCANCSGPFAPVKPPSALTQEATRFLRRAHRPIEPRRRWPYGLSTRSGTIDAEQRLLEGRALCVYGDAGWGRLVRDGKYREGRFDDQLVEAVVEMLAEHWQPDLTPSWVTAIPSLRAPTLVPDFAARLADRLGLQYEDALEKTIDTPQQKHMENSTYQAENALCSFRAIPEAILPGPVLLLDDVVDSRWSLTVCGALLTEAGSGPVLPVALAEASKARDT